MTVQPFRSSKSLLSDLQFGAAFTSSDVPEGIAALRGRTALDAPFLPVRFVGARFPPARRARSAMATGTVLGQGRIHPRPERARWAERGRRRFVSVHRNGLVCQRNVARDGGKEIQRRRTTPVVRSSAAASARSSLRRASKRFGFSSSANEGLPSTSPRADVVLGNRDRAHDGWLHLVSVSRNQDPGKSHPRGVHQSGSRSAAVAAGLLEPGLQRCSFRSSESQADALSPSRSPDAPAPRPVCRAGVTSSFRPDRRRAVRPHRRCRKSGCS